MFLIIGGVGLLGSLAGIVWMVVSYIKNKSFVFPVILFLLFFLLMGAGVFLEMMGGFPFGPFAGEPAEDVPQTDTLSPSPEDPDTPAGSENETVSLDMLCGLVEIALGGSFSGKDVYHDGKDLIANVWMDGLTEELYAVKDHGGESPESWENVKVSMVNLAESLCNVLSTYGQEDFELRLNILNDTNHENVLLSILDDTITYDVMEEEAAPETVSSPAASADVARASAASSQSGQAAAVKPANESGGKSVSGSQQASEGPQLPPAETWKDPLSTASTVSTEGPQLPPDGSGVSTAQTSSDGPLLPTEAGNNTGSVDILPSSADVNSSGDFHLGADERGWTPGK